MHSCIGSPSSATRTSATSRVGVRLLSEGVLATGSTGQAEVRYFRFFVRSAADVLLTLTPYSGNPSLFARFGCRPPNLGLTSSPMSFKMKPLQMCTMLSYFVCHR